MLRKQTVVELMPGLLNEAHRRAKGESDNITVVAMTWENQDDARVADTASLDQEEFATSSNTTEQMDFAGTTDDVTDEDIERAINIDCDVLQADGGTRCASITGSMVALADAVAWLREEGVITEDPLRDFVAAVSVGIVGGEPMLDLDYAEDSSGGTDMNVVMTGAGNFVEVQGTAEGEPFTREELSRLVDLASRGITELIALQRKALA